MNDEIKLSKGITLIFIYLLIIPLITLFLVKDISIRGPLFGILSYFNLSKNLSYSLLLLGCEIFTTLLIVFIFRKTLVKDFKIFKSNIKSCLKTSTKYWIVGIIIMVVSNYLINIVFFKGSIATNEVANRDMISLYPIYAIPSVIIFAPIVEELIFRRGLKDGIKNNTLYLIVSTLLFASIHLITLFTEDFSLVSDWPQLLYIIPYSGLGLAFGLAYIKTKTIYSSIFIHMLQNILSLAIILSV